MNDIKKLLICKNFVFELQNSVLLTDIFLMYSVDKIYVDIFWWNLWNFYIEGEILFSRDPTKLITENKFSAQNRRKNKYGKFGGIEKRASVLSFAHW